MCGEGRENCGEMPEAASRHLSTLKMNFVWLKYHVCLESAPAASAVGGGSGDQSAGRAANPTEEQGIGWSWFEEGITGHRICLVLVLVVTFM